MSKRNYVCFTCRTSVRADPYTDRDVICPSCGEHCENLGYKVPIPPKNKIQEWKALEVQYRAEKRQSLAIARENTVRKKHRIESEIQELESRPENPGRKALLKKLNKELETIKA
ncbi:MAG: hypothetical protein AAF571_05055 [Verrucomicrobiota bacterium]